MDFATCCKLDQRERERERERERYCKVICGIPLTLEGYEIEKYNFSECLDRVPGF